MAGGEGALPPSKKRVAGREISRDNPGLDDDDKPEPELGTFQRASEEILATRRIVKVCRTQQQLAPSSNPFVGINLVAPSKSKEEAEPSLNPQQPAPDDTNDHSSEIHKNEVGGLASKDNDAPEDVKQQIEPCNEMSPTSNDENNKSNLDSGVTLPTEYVEEAQNEMLQQKESVSEIEAEGSKETRKEDIDETAKDVGGGLTEGKERKNDPTEEPGKQGNGQTDTTEPTAPLSSFQQLSNSTNAFTGLAGTGFTDSSFSFGPLSKEGSAFGATNPVFSFGQQGTHSVFPSFGLGSSNNGSTLPVAASSDASKGVGNSKGTMQEVLVETGEENEKVVFQADAILFEYLDNGWKERGKGEVKVNVSSLGIEKARLVMRSRGNYRLILNANLYPEMSLKRMDKRGLTFSCVNSAGDGKGGLVTFALKFKDSSIMEEFHGAVTAHKGKDTELKIPENSPNASDD